MDLQVICAECSQEFKAPGDERFWRCSSCGREIENMNYPFLSRKIAHAKSHRSETDWEQMFDELLAQAREKVLALEAQVDRLRLGNPRRGPIAGERE